MPETRTRVLRFVAGLVLGGATWWVLVNGGFALLRAAWPAYDLASPERDYTLAMLGVRLVIFWLIIAGVAGVATRVSGDKRIAWIAGVAILALSIPNHLYPGILWDDYPVWYHYAYLLIIVPAAWWGGRATALQRDGRTAPA